MDHSSAELVDHTAHHLVAGGIGIPGTHLEQP
jgi:hypothetical protein